MEKPLVQPVATDPDNRQDPETCPAGQAHLNQTEAQDTLPDDGVDIFETFRLLDSTILFDELCDIEYPQHPPPSANSDVNLTSSGPDVHLMNDGPYRKRKAEDDVSRAGQTSNPAQRHNGTGDCQPISTPSSGFYDQYWATVSGSNPSPYHGSLNSSAHHGQVPWNGRGSRFDNVECPGATESQLRQELLSVQNQNRMRHDQRLVPHIRGGTQYDRSDISNSMMIEAIPSNSSFDLLRFGLGDPSSDQYQTRNLFGSQVRAHNDGHLVRLTGSQEHILGRDKIDRQRLSYPQHRHGSARAHRRAIHDPHMELGFSPRNTAHAVAEGCPNDHGAAALSPNAANITHPATGRNLHHAHNWASAPSGLMNTRILNSDQTEYNLVDPNDWEAALMEPIYIDTTVMATDQEEQCRSEVPEPRQPTATRRRSKRKDPPSCQDCHKVRAHRDYNLRCKRCYEKFIRHTAKPPELTLDESCADISWARSRIYPPVDSQGPKQDDVGQQKGRVKDYLQLLLEAICTPFQGNIELHGKPKPTPEWLRTQQRIFNGRVADNVGNAYSSDNVTARLRLLFEVAVTFHEGAKESVYPIGGDSKGYRADCELVFSERLAEMQLYLKECKIIAMNIIEGKGTLAFVMNPLAYYNRILSNRITNFNKKNKREEGDEDGEADDEEEMGNDTPVAT